MPSPRRKTTVLAVPRSTARSVPTASDGNLMPLTVAVSSEEPAVGLQPGPLDRQLRERPVPTVAAATLLHTVVLEFEQLGNVEGAPVGLQCNLRPPDELRRLRLA